MSEVEGGDLLDRVRAAIAGGPVTPGQVAGAVEEGHWLAVTLGVEAPSRDLLADVRARITAAFPDRDVEVRAGHAVHRGGRGFGEGRHVVAVVGGKGGVGKSTVAVNLALTLSAMGAPAGVLDADVNAPDVPHMLGLHLEKEPRRFSWHLGAPAPAPPSRYRPPHRRYGVEVMSAGLFVPEGVPPRVTSRLLTATLLRHLVFEVAWGARVLVVDAPPGTGEEVQVIAGELPLSAAIFVTTPQDVAQMDAERTLALLGERGVTVIGAVKNMAWMTCPHCGERIDMYRGSTRLADAGVETIAELPFDTTVSELVDRGTPLVLADPRGAAAREFVRIASRVRTILPA